MALRINGNLNKIFIVKVKIINIQLEYKVMITEEYRLNEINLGINRMKENLVSGRIIISMKD